MRIALAQMNPTTGAFDDNLAEACAFESLALEKGADLVVFPPYALCGDIDGALWSQRSFVTGSVETLQHLTEALRLPALLGTLLEAHDERTDEWYGIPAACYCADDDIVSLLSLDGRSVPAFRCGGLLFAVCMDGLSGFAGAKEKPDVIVEMSTEAYHGIDTLICANENLACEQECARSSHAYLIRMNPVGGADGAVYSGGSYALDPSGEVIGGGVCFHEDLAIIEIPDDRTASRDSKKRKRRHADDRKSASVCPDRLEADWEALVLSIRDYVRKNNLSDCVIGLSGGIDSALVATLAVCALGAESVHAVLMPSKFSSEGSLTDAHALAERLGIDERTIPIDVPLQSLCETLGGFCGGEVEGLALENIQARIRTVYLMALANTYGWMLLNTGNKSEAAMGFSTLYGDTAGAFAPLGDVYKTEIYELARWYNAHADKSEPVIPQAIIDKAPSAELYAGALDADRLPEYDILDKVLAEHVEGGKGLEELVEAGLDRGVCTEVLSKVRAFEFKRRQEPLAPQISKRSFAARGWPVTNRFSG